MLKDWTSRWKQPYHVLTTHAGLRKGLFYVLRYNFRHRRQLYYVSTCSVIYTYRFHICIHTHTQTPPHPVYMQCAHSHTNVWIYTVEVFFVLLSSTPPSNAQVIFISCFMEVWELNIYCVLSCGLAVRTPYTIISQHPWIAQYLQRFLRSVDQTIEKSGGGGFKAYRIKVSVETVAVTDSNFQVWGGGGWKRFRL